MKLQRKVHNQGRDLKKIRTSRSELMARVAWLFLSKKVGIAKCSVARIRIAVSTRNSSTLSDRASPPCRNVRCGNSVVVVAEILKIISHLFLRNFGWQRFFVRSILFWSLIFVALSVPNFGPLLDLIGASTMSLMTLIMPSIFYLYLNASKMKREIMLKNKKNIKEDSDEVRANFSELFIYLPRRMLVVNCISLTFGIVGGVVATVFSIIKMMGADVAPPCYVQYFREGRFTLELRRLPFVSTISGSVNCCGAFHNITVSGIDPRGFCAVY
ncbi:unnamed protein product [Strongylus vulgaris]|uniref:Amino acid transporter transmembrane domain-containing protein n=1 Tax=Strongylus vulgaris TaxID=40348 RepID=A0A3P7KRE4_STRVU|nr:unnamed protein product [Strongylus vulgaris]